MIIFMKRTLAFAKGSEELSNVKVDFLHISKCSFLEKKKKKKKLLKPFQTHILFFWFQKGLFAI